MTNNHVVEDSTSLKVAFIDSEVVDAAIKGTDAETDLAVIAVPLEQIKDDTKSKIKVARLGNSDELKVGQGVIAIGNALGYGQSVTVGYVSALNREVRVSSTSTRELLQTDAAMAVFESYGFAPGGQGIKHQHQGASADRCGYQSGQQRRRPSQYEGGGYRY